MTAAFATAGNARPTALQGGEVEFMVLVGGGKGDFGVSAKFPWRLTAVGKFNFDESFVKNCICSCFWGGCGFTIGAFVNGAKTHTPACGRPAAAGDFFGATGGAVSTGQTNGAISEKPKSRGY